MDGDMQTASDSDMQASPAHPFARSGQSIGCAIGFQPALSSADTHWNNLAMFAWQGQCEEAQFDPFDETVIVYHVGGAPSVPVRIGGRWNQETHPGLITIIPPATAVGWSVRGEVHSRSLHLGSRFQWRRLEAGTAISMRHPGSTGLSDHGKPGARDSTPLAKRQSLCGQCC